MKIDINKNVYDLVTENKDLKQTLINIGFDALENPLMFNTMAKKMSIKRGAKMLGIEDVDKKLEDNGYEVIDSSTDKDVIHRKKLIKEYIKRLTDGESLESVRADFVKNFENVSSAEIMDAEEELLSSGIDKKEVRKLCDVHSALFHDMTEKEKNDLTYDHPFLRYMEEENIEIKEIIKKALREEEFSEDLGKIGPHYKKKGDLIYPILKVKYNKPGPSDVMWAVDVEIGKALKKSIKGKNKTLLIETLKRAEEMTYKEDNILYPMVYDNLSKEDLDLLYKDLQDYDENLVIEEKESIKDTKGKEENYVYFKKGKLRLDQLEALLDTIEMEITFVDENDINSYYNDNQGAKIFKRPESSLGREVYTCHPPHVEPIVRGLVKDFKNNKRDSFKLVKKLGDKDFAISYYAVRDKEGNYKGVLETVQDLSFYKDHLTK